MNLNDPNFIAFDGTPVTGRAPPQMRVEGGRELTQQQMSAVMHAYKLFRDALRVSVGEFLVQNRTLPDGTRVRMESMQDRDVVYVWPTGSVDDESKLPHGFAVVTNWRGAKIYKRRLTWPSGEQQWVFAPDHVPQVKQGETTFDNQVFRKPDGKPFFNLPLVLRRAKKILWDYARRAGLSTSSSGDVVPARIKDSTSGAFTMKAPHYAVGGAIVDTGGAVLYTMADEAPILAPGDPSYPESVSQRPGVTDADGNQIALQAMRFALLSPSSNIWKFRLWNERIKRIGDATYEAIERSTQDIMTPWPAQTAVVTSVSDGSLGEDPANHFKFKSTYVNKPGAYSGAGSGRLYNIGWAGPDQWIDISDIGVYINSASALREINEQEAGGALSYTKAIVAPGANSTGYLEIESSLNYPATVYWRGGEALKAYSSEALAAFLGISVSSLPPNYRVYSAKIKRYDTQYDVDGSPAVTAKLGWKNLMLIEGTTTGRMSGKEHINELQQNGAYALIDSTWSYRWITEEIRTMAEFFQPYPLDNQYAGYWAWMDGANVKDVYWADYMAHGTHPGYTQTTAPNSANKYEYPFNDRPTNTAAYSLTSRYVIDYDSKGRFYAAIRCEVGCSGAEWEENLGVYNGYMQVKTHPSYVVKIYFESEWNGVFAQQLLVEESITRPMFEAITVSKFSPWYWPYLAYIDRDCKVRTPPEPAPDENFMMMFKNLASHQGANTNLCCADVRPDITGADVAKTQSPDGIEYSFLRGRDVVPHTRYVTGQLYARTFKLSDISESLWMLKQLKVDAVEDDFQPLSGPVKPTWFYHPVLKAALEVNRHIEVRDGIIEQWSDNLPGETSGYPPTPAAPPAATSREISLYRV